VSSTLPPPDLDAQAPKKPRDLPVRSWGATLRRTVKEFQGDNLTDWAAALTYYALLALFPALIVLVALLGLFGGANTIDGIFRILRDAGASTDTVNAVRTPLEGVIASRGGAGALFGFGLLGALWSASGYLGAFMRATNAIYGVEEGRPFWKLRPLQVLVTLLGSLGLAAVLIAIVVTGPLAKGVGNEIGLGSTAVTVWNIAKWPVLIAVVLTMLATLYYIAPNVKPPKFRWISPGVIVAVLLWIVATVGFFFYVSNFGSYNKTYGTLGGLVILLLWLWITNLALLFGAEFDAELERSRQLEAGLPADESLQLSLREEPK
jgi:membrane protein